MAIEEEEVAGIPEWVVTFGDMMSLLLTFFIMLVSMSEIKQEERFQALVESMRRRFGHESSVLSLAPGQNQPRNSNFENVASMGRAKRAHTMKGGDKVRAPVGDFPRVRTIRPGDQVTVGGVIFFDEERAQLNEENKRQVQIVASQIGGKPQKIEIRGHTSLKPPPEDSPYADNWQLAYERCHNTMEYLAELGINRKRIRLGVAGSNEPLNLGVKLEERKQNSRVAIVMVNQQVEDLEGKPETKDK